MRKWIDQSTFDELLLANAEDNVERAIQSASAVLEAVQEFVPEATLFYRVTHATDSLKNYFEEACTGFRRNGILFLVYKYTYPKTYYELRCEWSFFQYVDNYSYGKAFDKQSEPNRIGVFTKKKIDDWVEYLTQGFRNLERICGERTKNDGVSQTVGGNTRCRVEQRQKPRSYHTTWPDLYFRDPADGLQ